MSTKFTEYKGLNLPNVADEILNYWKENNIFEKSITTRDDNKPFIFFEGPPSANGLPGIHHAMGRTIKDIFCRYKTLKGFQVKRKAGWDTHGLPVELGVEKELGITKEDIGTKITIEEYNIACKKAVMKYTDIWNTLTEKMGYWVDMEDPYVTYKPKYMETVWWLLKQIYNKDLMYKGYTIQPYSPKAGTGLSSHEVNQPGAYQDVTDTTVVAQFKAITETLPSVFQNGNDVHILAWTTTPWTLPSNTALTVGNKIEYVLVKTFNQYTFEATQVVLGKPLLAKQFAGKKFKAVENEADLATYKSEDKQIPYLVIAECKGADLVGAKYEQLLPYTLPHDNPEEAFRVISGDFVTTEDGTGMVHTAPTFGADDAIVCKDAGVPPMLVKDENDNLVPLVDLQGKFTKEMGEFAGMYVKNEYYADGEAPERSVDVQIAIKLKEENKAFKVEKYVHSYPHCWRTDKPILYYPLDSWFIKVTEVKDRMHSLNEEINWKPESTGTGRFGNWLKNANDWNLSRSRFWGIPLPVWRTEDGKETKIVGSVAELKEEMALAVKAGVMTEDIFADFVSGDMSDENYDTVDLHKNVVDKITLVSASGEPMQRESDLIDVWFDSGAMPYAQWHYPFENKELVDNGWKTADFIAEGVDQTRGWFYTLHAIATMVFDDKAYKNVVSNGLVLDKNGQKMSKRLGNGVDPFTTLDKYGPDATRWYMISNANPWDNLKFDLDGITEVSRKFFGTLYNTYSFFSLYANLDNFNYSEAEVPLAERPEIDRWVLSELNTLVQKVDVFYAEYEPTKATRAISDFVQDHLSNWYVRLCRRRFWKGEYAQDKISAYQTLYTCMLTVAKLASPVAPFFMDKLYKDLTSTTNGEGFESVHLAEFPVCNEALIDKSLERQMENAQTISSLVLSLRAKEKIKVRQPLQKIMIPVSDATQKAAILAVADLIKSEVNVKEIELLDDASDILVKQIKPNFKALGPKFGKDMRLVASEIQKFTQDDIIKIEKEGSILVEVNGKNITLETADVEISSKDIEGWLVANAEGLTVALDVTINEELRKEGVARELINRIQNGRKETGLEVTDKIKLSILKTADLEASVTENESYIKAETLTNELVFVDELNNGIEIEFDTIKSSILIEKA
ncbi:isoleucine--tRNA ligase [Tenacibaculum finnmarkense]|uniref:isoleucine--tRNA ligase n=1 Tax=Tenacibaculum finnmarkense TaxID=2781243 RepID=UPI001EFB106B|nr:isoleucine--tRNA ligase [Tenacibaculum finnmarkense]MCG8207699.1 isoleucine--tRNA ligase [Tenacibaculum finnmarkense genomovar finnmarkense]MCG8723416.1 isoleucine--tRNA ligase [Tenacibaculum finnmarkense]MCG8741833.1 isoleucine--tRNA ligase [Tenacibaculum finnmarkense]MCG8765101.1 isoleucine--tRNA ligase [Tenacibaculum finnmarkense]MCG8778193.1 isoleucine--tRNA ligase [Tenacibaculum finnmarkense]